jgi:hypothetical protein
MGLTPDIERGVLNVPGGEWTLMLYRSTDLGQFSSLLNLFFRDGLDRQVAVTATQPEWDYTDAINFAPHLLNDPLPGAPLKQILVQESIGDSQVSNAATRLLARTMGITGFDLIEPVPGLQTGTPPLDSAYTQWDSHPAQLPPETNTSLPNDNGAHDSIWKSAKALQQIAAFCQNGGQVTEVCGGQCNLP